MLLFQVNSGLYTFRRLGLQRMGSMEEYYVSMDLFVSGAFDAHIKDFIHSFIHFLVNYSFNLYKLQFKTIKNVHEHTDGCESLTVNGKPIDRKLFVWQLVQYAKVQHKTCVFAHEKRRLAEELMEVTAQCSCCVSYCCLFFCLSISVFPSLLMHSLAEASCYGHL